MFIIILFYSRAVRKRRDFLDRRPCNLSSSRYLYQPTSTYLCIIICLYVHKHKMIYTGGGGLVVRVLYASFKHEM